MWNKSIAVIIVLLAATTVLVSSRSLSESEGHSCSAIKGLLDTITAPSSAGTTQKGESPLASVLCCHLNPCLDLEEVVS